LFATDDRIHRSLTFVNGFLKGDAPEIIGFKPDVTSINVSGEGNHLAGGLIGGDKEITIPLQSLPVNGIIPQAKIREGIG
jgi:hypothetical protein